MSLSSNVGQQEEEQQESGKRTRALVRTKKRIQFSSNVSGTYDRLYIDGRIYNSFRGPIAPPGGGEYSGVLGVTSARPGEGKTTVAANLAISLAFSSEREVVLVDCSFRRPMLHNIFELSIQPGLLESFSSSSIVVNRTPFDGLSVLTLGRLPTLKPKNEEAPGVPHGERDFGPLNGSFHTVLYAVRDILYSLMEEFDYVVLDLPSGLDSYFPSYLIQYLFGLIMVVDGSHTKREDIEAVLAKVGSEKLLGFVLNKSSVVS